MSKSNDLVLSYHDCVLRRADLNLLDGPCWLNDAIIGFYFEHLGQKYNLSSPKLLFISPELTQLLKLTDTKDYSIFLDPLKAKESDFIFFPVNDCDSKSRAGGSHWSLMVFAKNEKTFFYYDSSSDMNGIVAKDFSRVITSYLVGNGSSQFVTVECPQQENGYDCGLFVLCFADVIAEHILKTSKIEGCVYNNVKSLVYNKRRSLIALINTLKQPKQ